MLQAELCIAAEDFPAAHKAMGDLAEIDPTTRVLSLMAAIERGMGADDSVVRGYLARALAAPRGPQWICDKCGKVHEAWAPVCDACHAFDAMSWKRPPAGQLALPGGSDMLPLLVGGARPQPDPEV